METEVLENIAPAMTGIKQKLSTGFAKIKIKFVELINYLNKNNSQVVAALLVLYFVLLLFSIAFSNNKASLQQLSFPIVETYQSSLRNENLKTPSTEQ